MPNKDIYEAKKVWLKTKQLIHKGNIVKGIKYNKKGKSNRVTNFPGKKFSTVSHVRPHAQDTFDTYPLQLLTK